MGLSSGQSSGADREGLIGSEDRLLRARGLDERERRIVLLRFHRDLTEQQIANELGISQAHVSRLLSGALAKLRRETQRPDSRRRPASGSSGRFLVRMPGALHEQLSQAAEREHVSLNRFITQTLSQSVSASRNPAVPEPEAPVPAPLGRSRFRMLLVANLVIIVLAGAAAIALLVLALERGI
jgi:AraC-like DNA-binding protein